MTSLPKQWQNSDLCVTRQIIYHSKGIDKSFPKMHFFIEFEPLCQKVWAFLSNFGFFYYAQIFPLYTLYAAKYESPYNVENDEKSDF